MKKIVTLLALIILASCSSDDNNDVNNGSNKYLSSFSIGSDDGTEQSEVVTVIYDDNDNIKAFVADDDIIFAYKYDSDNNLISMSRGFNSDAEYTFQYTNGRLSGYTDVYSGTTTAITYNDQTKMYVIGDSDREIGLKGRDIGVVNDVDGENMYTFNYDDSKKGALYNVKGDNLFVLSLFSEFYQYLSVRPMTGISVFENTYTLENTYDSDGFLTKAAITTNGESQGVLMYQYTER
ncbi:hypothetical protein AMR72_08215 [Flavobacterium psychrophilum]|nr:hypothetical protein AMR72_08215 [Flavobacterium psychrophilum]AOE52491.1 hypothetical protein ALW18_08205 [Flavobacterium psychrophilum]